MGRVGHVYQCNKCKDTGVMPPNPEIRFCSSCVPTIDKACEQLVQWIRGRDPTYAMRLDGVMQEKHIDAKQVCGRFFSYVLRNSLQNEPVDDPFFADGVAPTFVKMACEYCEKEFSAQWPGQRFCTPACTELARKEGLVPPSKSTRPPVPLPEPEPEAEPKIESTDEPFNPAPPDELADEVE